MPDAMVLLPRTTSDEEQHEAILDLLEHRGEQALILAEELRSTPGVSPLEGPRLARTLRRMARTIDEAVDDPELATERAMALLAVAQPAVDEAERLIIGADVRLAVDEATFIGLADSVTAIGQLATVAFASYLTFDHVDLTELMPIEREAPVPLMHALQRVIGEGYVAARAQDDRPVWLARELEQTVGEFLDGYSVTEGPVALVSPFVRIGSVACDRIGERWRAEQPTRRVERYARARTDVVDATLATLALQRERLATLPDLAHWYDTGHAYGVIEQLLEQLADVQQLLPPRNLNAALWFELLMAPDEAPVR